MSYDLTIQPPSIGLDPRDRATVAAWIRKPPTEPVIPRGELRTLVTDLSRTLDAELHELDRRFEMVAEQSGVILVIFESGGWYEGTSSGLEAVWPALEDLCDRTGWVVFDPQLDKIVLGYQLVCPCGSSVDPYDPACPVCDRSILEARVPAMAVPPSERISPWEARALAQLEQRRLIQFRAGKRALVSSLLSGYGADFQEDPVDTVALLLDLLEASPDVDELFGEADEFEAALAAAGPP